MKYFFLKILGFLFLISIGVFCVFLLADGNSDPFYVRFTTKRQKSIILGTSKAAQGLQPQVFNEVLGREDFYNYSFTTGHSPYGPAYLRSIRKKIDPSTRNGIFILTVDPYSISSRSKNPNDSLSFVENELAVGDVNFVNYRPNLEYLIKHYPEQYIYILTKKLDYVNNDFLHDDGWYEVNIKMNDSLVNFRSKGQFERYERKLKTFKYSHIRIDYLIKTIDFLEKHGTVYLVRLPVSKKFLKLEERLMPDFDTKIKWISKNKNIPYKHFKDQNDYLYVDGVHLYKDSGVKVSERIAKWIKNN